MTTDTAPQTTPLASLHAELGAKLVDFAGWQLPMSFAGTLAEHRQTRESCSLFDVSHMSQFRLRIQYACNSIEYLMPLRAKAIKPGRCKYTVLCDEQGGIIDDLIVGCEGEDDYFIVSNASRRVDVHLHIATMLGYAEALEYLAGRALLAVQGPAAADICGKLFPAAEQLRFMGSAWFDYRGQQCRIARCGYTGEDGFEISTPGEVAEALAREILADERCLPAGLGARDVLRLEAGLCLYGNDIDEKTSICTAGLEWIVPRSLREHGDFIGAERLHSEFASGCEQRLVGLTLEGRTPARAGAKIQREGEEVGVITSGGFAPSLGHPIALAKLRRDSIDAKAAYAAVVRERELPCKLSELPFVPHKYFTQASVSTGKGENKK